MTTERPDAMAMAGPTTNAIRAIALFLLCARSFLEF
jgi:hypothetical protein